MTISHLTLSALWLISLCAGSLNAAPMHDDLTQQVVRRQNGDILYVRGGDIGRFDAAAPLEENLRRLFEKLGTLSNATKPDEFVITEQTSGFVGFKQLIGGVPVDARNEVSFGPDAAIIEIWLSVVSATRAPRGSPISKARAMQLASSAYAEHYAQPKAEVELSDNPGLRYRTTPREQPLILEYRFAATGYGLESAFVTVNALDETVTVTSATLPTAAAR